MTCKDCIFWEMCVNCNGYDGFDGQPFLFDMLAEQNETEIDCKYFKNKDEYQKVVHAKWEYLDNDYRKHMYKPMWEYMRCSSCGKTFYIRENRKYCNNCGAKMDLE